MNYKWIIFTIIATIFCQNKWENIKAWTEARECRISTTDLCDQVLQYGECTIKLNEHLCPQQPYSLLNTINNDMKQNLSSSLGNKRLGRCKTVSIPRIKVYWSVLLYKMLSCKLNILERANKATNSQYAENGT